MKEFYKNKKVLITGHTGFKGSWLTQILLNWDASIVGISLPPNTKPNLFEVLNLESKIFKNYFCDIRDFNKIKEILEVEKPEIVFHLAAQPIVRDSYDDPLMTHSTNIMGTANILQAVKEVGDVKSVVIITTDKVYENKEWEKPYKENDALGGYDPYSASKAAADIIANSYIQSFFNPENYSKKHNTLVAITRAGNVIGGGDWAKDRLVPDIIKAIFENKELVQIRNPKSVRPWQHVLEPLEGYLILGKRLYEGDKKISGAWNFGPQKESFVCVEDLVNKMLMEIEGGKYQIIEDNIKHEACVLKLNIDKAISALNWHPKWNFEETLKKTSEWYKNFYVNKEQIVDVTDRQIKLFFEK